MCRHTGCKHRKYTKIITNTVQRTSQMKEKQTYSFFRRHFYSNWFQKLIKCRMINSPNRFGGTQSDFQCDSKLISIWVNESNKIAEQIRRSKQLIYYATIWRHTVPILNLFLSSSFCPMHYSYEWSTIYCHHSFLSGEFFFIFVTTTLIRIVMSSEWRIAGCCLLFRFCFDTLSYQWVFDDNKS